MSKEIRVGDLVQVVRWPCCGARVGHVDEVMDLDSYKLASTCMYCGRVDKHPVLPIVITRRGWIWPLEWVKRIPPLSELEGQRTEEELREPVYSK